MRKLLGYREIWRTGLHTSHLGWRNFRVLVVTTDMERAKHMRDCARRNLGADDATLFWFADRASLAVSSPLAYQWIDGSGASRSLV